MMKNMKVEADDYLLGMTTEAPVLINSLTTDEYYSPEDILRIVEN